VLVIPSIDIFEGRCVRLRKGDYSERTTYSATPLEVANKFAGANAQLLHIVDLEGAREGKIVNWETIGTVVQTNHIDVQVGGGVRSASDVKRLLELGVKRVVLGSAAVTSPGSVVKWAEQFGPERFCIALDLRHGHLAIHGWEETNDTKLSTVISAMTDCGVRDFLSTDISKDGMLEGPNVGLYTMLVQTYPQVRWLASGGVSSVDHVRQLKETGVGAVIVGRGLIEEKLRLDELLEAAC
jgi:phosphoribosylformimino-5-aminoimidazole carboxamide ribotide isomerase